GYTAAGRRDNPYGAAGIIPLTQSPSVGPSVACRSAAALQPDGKLVVAWRDGSNNAIMLARLNSDGSLDGSFGAGGIAASSVAQYVTSVALQADGKIVVAGSPGPPFSGASSIARFNTNGPPDPPLRPVRAGRP